MIAPELLDVPAAVRPSGRVLRDYQHDACGAVVEDWTSGVARPAVLLPTGCGKTDVIAALATHEVAAGGRVLVLSHRTELNAQITERVAQHDRSIRVGQVQGPRDEVHYPITVAMIQSLASRRRGQYARLARFPQPTLVIVDECHHAAAPGYLAVLRGLGCFGPAAVATVPGCEHRAKRWPLVEPVRTLGVTATLVRGDDAALGDVWQGVAFARDIGWAVRAGHLVMPRGKVVVADSVKLERAKVRRGDYTDGELGKMITQSAAQIVADWVEHGRHPDGTPRSTAAFCPDLESAHALAGEFVAAGVPCGVVTGATSTSDRRKLYRALADGVITVLVSVMVLTEGWDCPRVSCILQCRPTKLPGLYTQIVGRGLRPWDNVAAGHPDAPPKVDCLILDVVGASRGQKLQTLVDLHESSPYDTTELDEALECPLCGQEHEGRCPMDAGDLEEPPEDEPDAPLVDPAGPAKVYTDLELLAADEEWTWLLTAARHPFLPVRDQFVFMWEAPGSHKARWSVGTIAAPDAVRRAPSAWLGHGLVLSEAKDLAERWASHEPGANLAQRSAQWRRGQVTKLQRARAAELGVAIAPGMTKSQVGDLLTSAAASSVIDALR